MGRTAPDVTEPEREGDVPGPAGIARGGAAALVFRILTAMSDTLVVVVTARGFGAEGRGLYALASFTGSLVITTLGGTSTALAAEWAHRRASLGRLYTAAVTIAMLGGAAVALVLGITVAIAWPDAKVLLFPAVAAPFLLLNTLQTGQFLAINDLRSWRWVILATSAVPLAALTVCAILAPGEPYLALSVWAGALAVVPVATLAVQRRRARFERSGLREVVSRLLRRGAGVSLANAVQLLNYRVDLIVVTAMLSLSDVGRYSVAIALGEALLIPSRALGASAYGSIVNADLNRAALLTVRSVRHSIVLLIGVAVALALGGRLLLAPVFGSEFEESWLPLALLLPGLVALGIGEQFRVFLLVRLERSRDYLTSATGAMVINLTLAIALIPPLGLAGAALATTISYVVGGAYLASRFMALRGDLRVRDLLPRRAELADYTRLARDLSGRLRRSG